MDTQKPIHVSNYDAVNTKRRALAEKCIANPADMQTLEALFTLIKPIADFVMHKYKPLPGLDREDYLQIAYITLWRVLNRIRQKPDILNNFEAYIVVSIRNSYISEYRKFVFKNYLEGKSFAGNDGSCNISYLYSMEEYVQRIISQRNAYRRAYRADNSELVRQREREYWSKNKDKKKEKDHRYYEKHKEKAAAYRKEYRSTHKEQRNAYERKYRAEHLEETRRKRNEYYRKNIEYQRAYRNAYNEAHRDVIRERSRAYYIKNRDTILAKGREYKRQKCVEQKPKESENG